MKIIIEVTQEELQEMGLTTTDELTMKFYESELDSDLPSYNIEVVLK